MIFLKQMLLLVLDNHYHHIPHCVSDESPFRKSLLPIEHQGMFQQGFLTLTLRSEFREGINCSKSRKYCSLSFVFFPLGKLVFDKGVAKNTHMGSWMSGSLSPCSSFQVSYIC